MDMELFRRNPLSRRTFVKDLASAGIGLTSLSALSALSGCSTGSTSNNGPYTVTVTDAPGDKNGVDYQSFTNAVSHFEKDNHNKWKIEGHTYQFLVETFYAKLTGGQQEDATRVFYTEPQSMITNGYIADVTDYFSSWEYFNDIALATKQIITGPNNRIYAIPQDGYKVALLYSRKLFTKAGLDPDKPPTTWDEFMDYSRTIKKKTGAYGFSMETTGNWGGWNFTKLLYSGGGRVEKNQGGKWLATFNDDIGVQTLQMLQTMRWKDKTMPDKATLNPGDANTALGAGQVAMVFGGSNDIAGLVDTYQTPADDWGVAPLPVRDKNDKNAGTLGGGNAWIFRKDASPEVLEGAVKFIIYYRLNPTNIEARLKELKSQGHAIGFDDNAAFVGKFQKIQQDLTKKYANVDPKLTALYFSANQALVPEPPIQTQTYYGFMDEVVQQAFLDSNADAKKLLDDLQQKFQSQTLDAI